MTAEPNLLDVLPPSQFTILPNTAGCYTAADAVRTLRLARELLEGHSLCKLEVLGDPTSLFPNMPETLKAAETLVREGIEVMVYCEVPDGHLLIGRSHLAADEAASLTAAP